MKSPLTDYSAPKVASSPDFAYWAFISYSRYDERWGRWLHKSLEQYRIPRRLVGKVNTEGVSIPKHLFPIFRDNEELASSANLGQHINEALQRSRYLIVVCSPNAVASKWVDAEIKYFKALGRGHRVLALIIDGQPNVSESQSPQSVTRECFPRSLRYRIDPSGEITGDKVEPLAADLRHGMNSRRDAIVRLVAGLIEVGFDDLRRRQIRRERIKTTTAALIIVSLILISSFLWMQFKKLREDRDARLPRPPSRELLAEQELMGEFEQKSTVEFPSLKISTSNFTQEITFGSDGVFLAGDDELSDRGKRAISFLVRFISERNFHHIREIRVYAHTDSLPIRSERGSNWELSALRAVRVVRYMEEEGIKPRVITLTPIAPGEYQPAVPESSVEGKALNRRIRIQLIYVDSGDKD